MGIKGYKSMLSSINQSMKESEKNFDDARMEKIKKGFNELRDIPSKPKINEIREDLYRIGNKKKEIEKNFLKLEKNLSKLKRYYDYDDIEYN